MEAVCYCEMKCWYPPNSPLEVVIQNTNLHCCDNLRSYWGFAYLSVQTNKERERQRKKERKKKERKKKERKKKERKEQTKLGS
jgi:hypothetical protein